MDKLVFALTHWSWALAMSLSAVGLGAASMRLAGRRDLDAHGWCTAWALGWALLILLLLALAVCGLLRVGAVWVLLILGWGLAVRQILAGRVRIPSPFAALRVYGASRAWQRIGFTMLAILAVLPLLFMPLQPPHIWDELMYHLPHAREWAVTGHLTINEWLRYAWSPMGTNLVYAAALLLQDEVLAHVVNASFGLGTAALLWSRRQALGGPWVAAAAAVIWLALAANEFRGATADLGLTMFVTAAFLAVTRWLESTRDTSWLYAAAFLVGAATGVKYQALMFAGPFAVVLFYAAVRGKATARQLLLAGLLLILPAGYWYLRNWIAIGNPFNPLAGSIFGYYDWQPEDMVYQMADLANVSDWPKPVLWPAAFAMCFASLRRSITWRVTYAYVLMLTVTWYFSSHYARYLMPAFPLLALLSAASVMLCLKRGLSFLKARARLPSSGRTSRIAALGTQALPYVLMVGLIAWAADDGRGKRDLVDSIETTVESRDQFLIRKVGSYALSKDLQHLHIDGHKTYQIGLENMIYYLPRGVRGDHFGRWRYRDMPPEPERLATKMNADGAQYLLLAPRDSKVYESQPGFRNWFKEIAEWGGARAYELISAPESTTSQ